MPAVSRGVGICQPPTALCRIAHRSHCAFPQTCQTTIPFPASSIAGTAVYPSPGVFSRVTAVPHPELGEYEVAAAS